METERERADEKDELSLIEKSRRPRRAFDDENQALALFVVGRGLARSCLGSSRGRSVHGSVESRVPPPRRYMVLRAA